MAKNNVKGDGAVSISGWLILSAVLILINPILLLLNISLNFSALRGLGASPVEVAVGDYISINLFLWTVLFFYYIAVVIFFFRKKRKTKPLYISLLVVQIVFSLVSFGVFPSDLLDKETVDSITRSLSMQILGTLIVAVILIPYFIISKRVKATFVR